MFYRHHREVELSMSITVDGEHEMVSSVAPSKANPGKEMTPRFELMIVMFAFGSM